MIAVITAGRTVAFAQLSSSTFRETKTVYPSSARATAGATARSGSSAASAFNIVINPTPALAANTAALAAFNRAAQEWTTFIHDPITVTIDADLSTIGPDGAALPMYVIGESSAVFVRETYSDMRSAMVADAAAQPGSARNAIITSLPTAAQFSTTLPAGRSFSGNLIASKANLKALGFTGLDATNGVADGSITFNPAYAFDYDSSDGVTPGLTDFESVAAHEIGHALGFVSTVDDIDQSTAAEYSSIDPTTLDLFRFARLGANPATAADFTTMPRDLVPGTDDVTDDTTDEFAMSTGASHGDGRQASHWKDDNLTGTYLGTMDPTLPSGVSRKITYADLRAMDLIGYDLNLWSPGDANHDERVNFDDLVALAQNYNMLTGKTWTQGDFTGDGAVNFDDLVILAQNYNTSTATLAASLADVSPAFAADWALAQSLVPEPTMLAAIALGGCVLSRRRRR